MQPIHTPNSHKPSERAMTSSKTLIVGTIGLVIIVLLAVFLVSSVFDPVFEKIDDRHYKFKQDKYTLLTSKIYPGFMLYKS